MQDLKQLPKSNLPTIETNANTVATAVRNKSRATSSLRLQHNKDRALMRHHPLRIVVLSCDGSHIMQGRGNDHL